MRGDGLSRALHRPARGPFEIAPQPRNRRRPLIAVHADDPGGELPAAFDMPAEAPIEALRADPIAAAQDAVLADAALFGLLGRKIILGDRHEGGAVEPVDGRRHVAIDVDALGR